MSIIPKVLDLCASTLSESRPERGIRQLIPCFWGDTGVGKTQQTVAWAKEHDYHVCIVHVGSMESPADLIGMPDRDPETGKTVYLLPDWFDFSHKKVLVLFDEINRGNLLLQQALFPILGDYMVGPHKIPKHVLMVAAANPPTEEFNVTELDMALVNRMWHIPITPKVPEWVHWANKSGINPDIVDFVDFHETAGSATKHVIQIGQDAGKAKKGVPLSLLPKLTPTGKSYEMVDLGYSPNLPKFLCKLLFDGLLGPGIYEQFIPFQSNKERPLRCGDILGNYGKAQGTIVKWGSVRYGRPDLLDLTLQRVALGLKDNAKALQWAIIYTLRSRNPKNSQLSFGNRINEEFDFASETDRAAQANFMNFLGDLSSENRQSLYTLLSR